MNLSNVLFLYFFFVRAWRLADYVWRCRDFHMREKYISLLWVFRPVLTVISCRCSLVSSDTTKKRSRFGAEEFYCGNSCPKLGSSGRDKKPFSAVQRLVCHSPSALVSFHQQITVRDCTWCGTCHGGYDKYLGKRRALSCSYPVP